MDSRGKVVCFNFTIVSAVPRKYKGFVLYRQIWQCNENITNCLGKWLWFYQLGFPTVRGFKQGSAGQKLKFPLFPGAGAVVTSALSTCTIILCAGSIVLSRENLSPGFPTRFDTNQVIQPLKMA